MNFFKKSSVPDKSDQSIADPSLEVNEKRVDYYDKKLLVGRITFLNILSIIGIYVFVTFGLMYIFNGTYQIGLLELGLAFILIINIIVLKRTHNISVASSILLFIILVILVYLLFDGGIEDTGVFWFFIFPLLSFFLKGRRGGALWTLLLLLIVFGVLILNFLGYATIPYSVVVIRQLGISLLILSVVIFSYQSLHDSGEKALESNKEELVKAIKQLVHEIGERKKTEKNLAHIVEEKEEKFKLLEDTKKAMLNLLEDLEKEKAIVEREKAKDEAVLVSVGDGLVVTDKQGKILLVNKAFEELIKWKADEVMGQKFEDIVPMQNEKGTVIPPEERAVHNVLQNGTRFSTNTFYYVKKDGTRFPVNVTGNPISLNGETIGSVIVFYDITKEKEIDRAKSEFVSLASHQLRTPLSSINWYTEMILSGDAGDLTPEQKDFLNEVYEASQRMTALVNALLNVSRIDLGTFVIDPKPTDLIAMIKSVLKEAQVRFNEKHQNIQEKYEDAIPNLNADPKLLRIVVENLITNAIKYTPENGSVTISVDIKDRDLKDENNNPKGSVIISVADTGYGIPKEQQSRMFSKLFRADNIKDKVTDGTGLGLYMVKSIMDQGGGAVSFESEEGKGTTFYLSIPLSGMRKKEGTKELS